MDAQAENPHPTRLTNIVEDVVDNRLARLERLVLNIKDEQNTRETAAEKALKARTKKERKERENEREELVEAIRDMALEEKEKEAKEEDPVLLKDCVGRNFVFPFEECRGWKRFAELIRQAFDAIDFLGPHVNESHYDILDPQGRVVLPSVWDAVVEPGWEVSMHMWPMNQDRIEEKRAHQARFDGRVGLGCGEERLRPNWHLGSETPCGFDGEEKVIIIDEGRGQPIRAARDQPLHWPHRLADIDESDVGDSIISIAASEQRRPRTPAFLNLLTTTQRTAEPIIFCQNCKRHLETDPRIERFPDSPNQRLERHLLAEKQLTATLEEAIVDLESQNKGVRAEMEGWRVKCRAYEARLARMYVGTGFGAVDGEATKMGEGGLAVRRYDSGEGVVAGCEKLGGLGAEESFDEWEEAVVED